MKLNEISTYIKDRRAQGKGSESEKKAAERNSTSSAVLKHARVGLNKAKKFKDRKKAERNPRKNTKHKAKAFESAKKP